MPMVSHIMPNAGQTRKPCRLTLISCVLDIVTLSDFDYKASNQEEGDKVQVYISGTLHGDERIGPQVAYYLMEYLVSNYQTDP